MTVIAEHAGLGEPELEDGDDEHEGSGERRQADAAA
jgi:hypothetical protein